MSTASSRATTGRRTERVLVIQVFLVGAAFLAFLGIASWEFTVLPAGYCISTVPSNRIFL